MSPEEARNLFSEAFEGELDPERKKAFDAALAGDGELRHEYDEFVETFQFVARMGTAEDDEPTPDLLHGVQERLRKRSRGRFYRDRFSERAGPSWMLPLLLAMACVLVLASAWYALHSSVVLESPPSDERAPSSTER